MGLCNFRVKRVADGIGTHPHLIGRRKGFVERDQGGDLRLGGVLIENPTEGILRYCREVLGIGTGCMLAAYRKLIPYFQEGKISRGGVLERGAQTDGGERGDARFAVARGF